MLEHEDLEVLRRMGWNGAEPPLEFLRRSGIYEMARRLEKGRLERGTFTRALRALFRSRCRLEDLNLGWWLWETEEAVLALAEVAIEEGLELDTLALESVGTNVEVLEKLHSGGFRFQEEQATEALFRALRSWKFRALALVLEMGADPNGRFEGQHPLEWWAAEDFGTKENIRYLLFLILVAYGADLSAIPWGEKEQEGCWQVIEEMPSLGEFLPGKRLFEATQALGLLGYRNKYGEGLLHVASAHGWVSFIRQAKGYFDFNERTSSGRTPLHLAVVWTSNPKEIIDALVEGGADPNLLNEDGRSPLAVAVFLGENLDLATRILAVGGRIIGPITMESLSRCLQKANSLYRKGVWGFQNPPPLGVECRNPHVLRRSTYNVL